ncbi:WYL domain-containing protein [Pontibacter mangrovi]|uniref:WYL domain-containing protein n=1 Tax=Pontibacter mangrovi TaxID=2589816 RepID=A0A501WHB3_9BACT|nr:WYL domain-containing protein [Pontibacter mangrovi]TPE45006.1 WYL domain-containing protein [Pontibacter mangrovi]
MYSQLLEELSKAIGARLLVSFKYEGERHTVEPHLLGQDQQHQDCLLAWRKDGNPKQNWHRYPLSQMKGTSILEERFCKKRPGYDPYDSTMTRVYYRI